MVSSPPFSYARVTRFFIPLLLQAFSQSLTYPLVAGIVTHGEFGVNALTAFSQGQMIMFMIGALGGGLITTGMVFAKTWYGYVSYRRLNALMMTALIGMQALAACPPFDRWIFEGFFALPPELARISGWTLLFGTVMNVGFFLRNIPLVVLFNHLESAKANNATLVRIALTLVCSAVFPQLHWVGPKWGLLALTLGVWAELGVSYLYARRYLVELRTEGRTVEDPVTPRQIALLTREQLEFTLPLAVGYLLLATAPIIIAAFVARTADAAAMLTIHYVTIGVANPIAYGALRLQTVAVKFPPEYEGDRRLLKFAVVSGAILGIVPFLFHLPIVGDWYFGVFQNVPRELIGKAELAIGIYSVVAVFQAIRARIEGIAAYRRRPGAVMAGQIAYSLSLCALCAAFLWTGIPGYLMAVLAITIAPVCTAATVYAALGRDDHM